MPAGAGGVPAGRRADRGAARGRRAGRAGRPTKHAAAGGAARLPDRHEDEPAARPPFWPFAEFSPEWQAIRWAVDARRPGPVLRPARRAHRFAAGRRVGAERRPTPTSRSEPTPDDGARIDPIGAARRGGRLRRPRALVGGRGRAPPPRRRTTTPLAPFAAIAEAMAAVRGGAPPPAERGRVRRGAARGVHAHGPARGAAGRYAAGRRGLRRLARARARPHRCRPAAADAAVLKGLPKAKVAMTWVPWTHGRLASLAAATAPASTSPGWYHHLFTAPDRPVARWLVDVAGVLREEDLPVSTAHVIEAVRLAETLATLRGRPLAGLAEVTEATRAVLCDGDELRLALVNRRLVVGERLGEVPDDTPRCRWPRDLAAPAAPAAAASRPALDRELDLDLRRDDRPAPQPAAAPAAAARRRLGRARPTATARQGHVPGDLAAALAAGVRGRPGRGRAATAPRSSAAATAKVAELAGRGRVAGRGHRAGRALPAGRPGRRLPDRCCGALDDRAALDADVAHLMAALPALARTLRYGDVRGTDVGALRAVTDGLVVRVCVGLPAAVAGLDDDAAAADARPPRRRARGARPARRRRARPTSGWTTLARPGRPGRPARAAGRPADPAAARRRPARPRRGRPPDGAGADRRRAAGPRPRPGSRASSPAAGCCWCTTSGCWPWSTPG